MGFTGITAELDRRVVSGHEEDIQKTLDAFPFYVLLVDSDHNIVMANTALHEAFGLKAEDVIGAFCPKLIHGTDEPYEGCPLEEAHTTRVGLERELYDEERDAWLLSGVYPTQFVSDAGREIYLHTALDITAKKKSDEALAALRDDLEKKVHRRTRELAVANNQLKRRIDEKERAQAVIHRLAYYDMLTGLPNRTHFNELVREQMTHARESGACVGFAVLDLDGFKEVNDTGGHQAGDKLLQLVGLRLDEAMRDGDSAARMGGDEFMFMFPAIRDRNELDSICRRLLGVFEDPFLVDGERYTITGSFGSAMFPQDGDDECALMRLADRAMYAAKGAGKNRYLSIVQAEDVASG